MSNKEMEVSQNRPSDWPVTRLVSFATMLLTFAIVVFFIVTATILNFWQPDLGDQPLLLPLLGAVLVAGSLMALLGLVAGIVDLTQSKDKRGISVIAVVVNGGAALFVFAITVIGLVS
jgi:succinate dehydrogenase hydrophobic anchor subunit